MIITFKERKELFKSECKVINLDFEYQSCVCDMKGCLGNVKWAIITELTEDELLEQYGDVISKYYFPYVLLNGNQGATILDFYNIDAKYRMRQIRNGHAFDITDGCFEQHHPDMAVDEDILESIIHNDDIKRVRKALCNLNNSQKRRVIKYYFYDKTLMQIAKEEGVSFSSVRESIEGAIKKIKKIF